VKAIILAAGRGTRLGALTEHTPKPMLEVAGQPMLAHIVGAIAQSGITEFVFVTRYRADVIEAYFGDGAPWGWQITHIRQPEGYGTGVAVMAAQAAVGGEEVLIAFGDILVPPSTYRGVLDTYRTGCAAALALIWVDDPWAGAAVLQDEDTRRITGIIEKPPKGTVPSHWNNAGVFACAPVLFDYLARLQPSVRGEYELPQALDMMVREGQTLKGYRMQDEYWQDIGTPEDLLAASALLRPGG
jgi:NDP-sugar pyrophosphorylase family protein